MNKSCIMKALNADQAMCPDEAVAEFLRMIEEALRRGETVSLRDFGKFTPRTRRPRLARNPRTGAAVQTTGTPTVGFIPSPALRQRLQGGS